MWLTIGEEKYWRYSIEDKLTKWTWAKVRLYKANLFITRDEMWFKYDGSFSIVGKYFFEIVLWNELMQENRFVVTVHLVEGD